MNNFFRYVEDGQTSIQMPWVWFGLLVSVLVIYRFRTNEKLLTTLIVLGLGTQGLMLYWYLGNPKLFLMEGLPLYHCRIAAIMTGIGYFTHRPKLTKFFAWLGLVGALVAFSVPDPSPYLWPHVSNITYVGNHVLLILIGIMVLSQEKVALEWHRVLAYSVSMNIVIVIFNQILGYNYSYLQELPPALNFQVPMLAIFSVMTALMVGVIYGLDRQLTHRQQHHIVLYT